MNLIKEEKIKLKIRIYQISQATYELSRFSEHLISLRVIKIPRLKRAKKHFYSDKIKIRILEIELHPHNKVKDCAD